MKPFSELKPSQTKLRSERAFVLSEIIEQLKAEGSWPFNKMSKTDGARLTAVKTSHLTLKDLRDFYKDCWRVKAEGRCDFGKCFWGQLKIKK